MFDTIRELLIWIIGGVLDRQLESGDALRVLGLVVLAGLVSWLGLSWRGLAYRLPSFRRKLLPQERYTGRYLLAIRHDGEIRYGIVGISFNSRARRFEAEGRIYDRSGDELSSFRSNHVIFPSGGDGNIEFIWQQGRSVSGYTRMRVEQSDAGYTEGDGFLLTFSAKPHSFPLMFKHLHGGYVRDALGVAPPDHPDEEPRFIKTFHATLGEAVRDGFAALAEEV